MLTNLICFSPKSYVSVVTMNYTSFLLYNFAFLFTNALSKNLHDDVVGVSNKKINDYGKKVAEGFRDIILHGDDELGYPIMDPYTLIDLYWNYDDELPKHELYLKSNNETKITGLSEFQMNFINIDIKRMSGSFLLYVEKIEIEGPYNLNGHLFKKGMPLYGSGDVKLVVNHCYFAIDIDLDLVKDFIVVEKIKAYPIFNDYNVTVTGLMDLPTDFASLVIQEQLEYLFPLHFYEMFQEYVVDLVEDSIGGMTMEELFDYFDYLVDKVELQR